MAAARTAAGTEFVGQTEYSPNGAGPGSTSPVTADQPRKYWFETYSRSAPRFREIAAKAGADALISQWIAA